MRNKIRDANSDCLLCKQSKALKTNSHIIPGFMTKSILGNTNKKRVYLLGTDRMHKSAEYSQDTDKEDYILCTSCEKYLSILETYIANRLHDRLWNIRYESQFPTYSNGEIKWRVCEQIDESIFRLFFYSIIWRCHIASTEVCKNFKLIEEEAESIRVPLLACKYDKHADFIANLPAYVDEIPIFPFIIFTAENFGDRTKNIISPNSSTRNPYEFIFNEYVLYFSFTNNEKQNEFQFLNNTDNSKIKIGFFSYKFWETLRKQHMDFFVDVTKKNLKKRGEIPWGFKHDE
ncbi:MAG: hypothetical protein IPP60_03450 [Sphingobacteriales bacterium]|nr:hypothetical protein [Sphingobacteriales bacterium]